MSGGDDLEPPSDFAGEVNAAADFIGDVITGKTSVREEAEGLLERAIDGLFGAKKKDAPPSVESTGKPSLTVHNGGKCG